MHTYTPDPTQPFPTGYTVPDDGDLESAASVNVPIEGEANVIARLSLPATDGTKLPELASRTYTYAVQGPATTDFVTGSTPAWLLGPGVNATQNDVTAPFKVWQVLDVPHGSTLKNIIASLVGSAGHGALPGSMPALGLYKIRLTTGAQTLLAGPVSDPSASTAVYEANHQISLGGALSIAIDRSLYVYVATLSGEFGANSQIGLSLWSFSATRQVTILDAG